MRALQIYVIILCVHNIFVKKSQFIFIKTVK
jgi:hypothetical protein